jgi:hypothetical protein
MSISGKLLTTAMAVMPRADVDRTLELALSMDVLYCPQLQHYRLLWGHVLAGLQALSLNHCWHTAKNPSVLNGNIHPGAWRDNGISGWTRIFWHKRDIFCCLSPFPEDKSLRSTGNLNPHDLRRHAATYASRAGTPIEIVSKVILRHANLSTTQRYLGKIGDTEAVRCVWEGDVVKLLTKLPLFIKYIAWLLNNLTTSLSFPVIPLLLYALSAESKR